MPIQVQVSALHRLVVIVARGHIAPRDIREAMDQVGIDLRSYGKIIDVSLATSELTMEQVERVASALRERAAGPLRGPIAFVINPQRRGFAHDFAEATEDDRPVKLFRSIHEARRWLQQTMEEERRPAGGKSGSARPST